MALDRERLAKIMALTTSPIEGEASAAMHKANAIVAEAGMDWHQILAVQQKVVTINIQTNAQPPGAFGLKPEDFSQSREDEWLAPHLSNPIEINTMFRAIYAKQPESPGDEFWTWVDSVHQHWLDRKSVTPGQYRALKRCHLRAERAK